ncbi:MAG: polysaccharide biosynthesis/export family protein, partial [Candidatus Binataceae bacterium]
MSQVLKESHGRVKCRLPEGVGAGAFCWKAQTLIVSALFSIAAFVFIAGCSTQATPPPIAGITEAHKAYHDNRLTAASDEAIQEFGDDLPGRYTLGSGDTVNVTVWARPELSGQHIVGPDGDIQVPFLGSLHIGDLTPDEASAKLSS